MSLYELPAEDPRQRIEVGWSAELGTYWAAVWDAGNTGAPLSQHGLAERISNVYDLLSAIRGYLADDLPQDVIVDLLDDPWREAAGSRPTYPQLAELLANASNLTRSQLRPPQPTVTIRS